MLCPSRSGEKTMIRPCLTLALGAALLGGCAGSLPPAAALGGDVRVERGRALAERRCAGCHTIGLDASSAPSGPRFRDLRMRTNPLSLSRRFAEISAHGIGEMPPVEITGQQAEDLIAYFESLGPTEAELR
jgi:mono/diheme cytochrome c family protein